MTHKLMPVSIGLIIEGNKVLIGKRTTGHYAGFWEFPGGKVEKDESSYCALQREMHEELGININNALEVMHIRKQHPHITVHLNVWHVTAFSGSIIANEQQELQWIEITKLSSATTIPTNLPIIEYLEQLEA